MHIDLDEQKPQTFEADVCVIGGGIAGLTLATRLGERGIRVHLLEAGGLEQEARSQAFYATEQAGDTHRGASAGRYRTFGGSSTQWGGQLLPFTADILSPPAGVPSRAWPVSEAELTPHYEAIHRIFEVDRLPFDAALLPALGIAPVDFSAGITLRFSKWAPFKRRNLAQTLGPGVLASDRITLFTHANVATLEGCGGTIEGVRALNYAGNAFRFTARYFVVAAGTIESSRILLCSVGSGAAPNENDQIGRYFNDHLSFHAAEFESPARAEMIEKTGPFFVDGTLHTCKLEASAAIRSEEHLLATMAHVIVLEPEDSGTAAIRNLLRSLQSGKVKEAIAVNLAPMLRGAGDVLRLVMYAKWKKRRAVSKRAQVMLNVDVEQAPDPENRIRLSTEKDGLGLPMAVVDWRVGVEDFATAVAFARLIRGELARLGLTSLRWHSSLDDGSDPPLLDTYHAMGGLCMGDDPATSVVDAQLQVHGVTNLFVASCAVFPSGSSSNPTFTMMALTLRLADHLAGLMVGEGSA